MGGEHEYALLGGVNRSRIGRYIYSVAAVSSAVIVFLLLSIVDLAKAMQVDVNVPPSILSLLGAGSVYLALYMLFDKVLWKTPLVGGLLKIPDLSGEWLCEGTSLEGAVRRPWIGTVRIVQSWDRFQIRLTTPQSSSDSVAAALRYDPAAGYQLMYHYRNQPKIRELDLSSHHGFADLLFEEACRSAEGGYFNGRGRTSHGELKLTRKA